MYRMVMASPWDVKRVVPDRPGIDEALELRAEGRRLGQRRRFGEQQYEGEADAKNCLLNPHGLSSDAHVSRVSAKMGAL